MRNVLPALATLALLAAAPLAGAQHAHEGHAAPATVPSATAAAPSQRFAADATLRQEMADIRVAVNALDHYVHGHMAAEQAQALGTKVEDRVRHIIANCKLPPDADAAMHTIIVPLMQNAAALRKHPQDTTVVAPMRDALEAYARQFDDPGFAAAR